MAPAIIDFHIRPFIYTQTDDAGPSVGFGAAANVSMSGAKSAQVKVLIDTYFTYKYAAAQMQVNCEDARIDPESACEMWEVFALCQKAMAGQTLLASSSDADRITFSLTRAEEPELSLSPKRLIYVPDDSGTSQTPRGRSDRARRGRPSQGVFTFVIRSGDYRSSEQLVRGFGAELDRLDQMDEASRRTFLASEEVQARLKADALISLTAHVPIDSIDSFDWHSAISELACQASRQG